MMGADRQSKVELMLKQSLKELLWIQKQLSLIANASNGPVETKLLIHKACRSDLGSSSVTFCLYGLRKCHRS
ncbi:hypothetical protein Q7C36_012256 [Tachysurus vachellii]|uniref:Uncharacterized protein n=1 Tax=Tachysurus vachellii TaxID=175792 RepID=A0AA88SPI4_TACVA|nr:hypothetical protein Q7C36_012256 [Tachysurus vachellii]